jgi:hypothetical protein
MRKLQFREVRHLRSSVEMKSAFLEDIGPCVPNGRIQEEHVHGVM